MEKFKNIFGNSNSDEQSSEETGIVDDVISYFEKY